MKIELRILVWLLLVVSHESFLRFSHPWFVCGSLSNQADWIQNLFAMNTFHFNAVAVFSPSLALFSLWSKVKYNFKFNDGNVLTAHSWKNAKALKTTCFDDRGKRNRNCRGQYVKWTCHIATRESLPEMYNSTGIYLIGTERDRAWAHSFARVSAVLQCRETRVTENKIESNRQRPNPRR